ncbi:hypothetical protein GCM10009099_02040 [Caenispirillum bisanense]
MTSIEPSTTGLDHKNHKQEPVSTGPKGGAGGPTKERRGKGGKHTPPRLCTTPGSAGAALLGDGYAPHQRQYQLQILTRARRARP